MPLLKLSCANCSAPLEIGEELEHFTCSYCGTAQIVERSGGAVWARKMEKAISAVQSGTDRTAAELALVRLERELAQAQESKAALIRSADAKLAQARARRKGVIWLAFLAAFFLVPILLVGKISNDMLWLVWAIACTAAPIAAEKSVKMPSSTDNQRAQLEINAQIAQIERRIAHNRALLDT